MDLTGYNLTGRTDAAPTEQRTAEEWRALFIQERNRADKEAARADALAQHLDAVKLNIGSVAAVKRGLRINDSLLVLESWWEISHYYQRLLWRAPTKCSVWDKGEREKIRELESGIRHTKGREDTRDAKGHDQPADDQEVGSEDRSRTRASEAPAGDGHDGAGSEATADETAKR